MRPLIPTISLVTAVFLLGCQDQVSAPTAESDAGFTGVTSMANLGAVVNHVSMGGADICGALGLPDGCDANFSLTANLMADGSVTGQYHDQFAGGVGGIHASIDCLTVIGNQAWVSGTITNQPFAGFDVVTTVVDNGAGANDAPDQLSFSFIGTGVDCQTASGFAFPLFNVTHGQVMVR